MNSNPILPFFCLALIGIICQSCGTTKSKFEFDKVLWAAAWSPDGTSIAVGGGNDQLRILSPEDLSIQNTFSKLNTITKIKWHPNGKLIAITRQGTDDRNPDDNKAQIIDIENGTTIDLDIIHARGLEWTKNGKMLAVGDGEGVLRLYSKEGILIKTIQTEQKSIIDLSWHPSNKKIVTIGSHIEIIDVSNEQSTKIIPREIEILMLCVEWHPSGAFSVTGDYGDFILDYPPLLIFWDYEGKKLKTIQKSKAEYRNLSWSTNGKYLATASDKIRLWSEKGALLRERNTGSLLWGIDFNRNGEKIVVSSEDGKVIVLDEGLNILNKSE